ncbi:AtrD, ABC-transporter [Xylaria cf. heliscus]|nr:AtrD, ABC-transporter [Xylaria cf. heliscus]
MHTGVSDALGQWLDITPNHGPGARLSVSFLDLHVYGFTSSTDYQTTVGSYILAAASRLGNFLGSQQRREVHILRGFDGLVRSGEVLLVLGRPGSGCSTFLKTLTGHTHGIHLGAESNINYQGISFDNLHQHCSDAAIYQAELDVHFPELALGETLTVAAAVRKRQDGTKASSGDDSNPNDKSSPGSPSPAALAATIFGLKDSFHTLIGSEMIRGVSGGEKKRTSIAEAFMATTPIQAWDNTTRGLDSLTALNVVTILKRSAAAQGNCVMVSLYQASRAIYDQCDKVSLLYEGRQIYFGSADHAVRYFDSLGFVKSERLSTPDFLTALTNPAERVDMIRPGFESKAPRSVEDFVGAWLKSTEREALIEDIEVYNSQHPCGQDAVHRYLSSRAAALGSDRPSTSPYSVSIWHQISICVQRGFWRLRNNYVPIVSGVAGNTILAIIVGSVFLNLPDTTDSFTRRAVLLFYSIVINACISAFEVLTMWAARPIVEKHSAYKFYHPYIESIASILCDIPNKFLTSIGFNIPIYFMTGLQRTPGHFFTFYLFSFVCLLTMSMFFRMVGSLSSTLEQSMAPVANLMLLFIIYAGFVIPAKYMRPWLGWLRWINPISYAYESLMLNEFSDKDFTCSDMVPSGPAYGNVSDTEHICSVVGSLPGENFVRGARYLELQYDFVHSHLWRNLGILIAMTIAFCLIHLLAVEYIPAQRSKGEVLLFRRGHTTATRTGFCDEETSNAITTLPVGPSEKVDKLTPKDTHSGIFDALQKQTAIFHWDGICFDIKTKTGNKRILNEVDGWVKPGTLTALMGTTGAGKTSLLDALACRTTVGVISGAAYIDGKHRDDSFQRKTGYVQQNDIHLATNTVREALTFSALLRQPRTTPKVEKLRYVEHVLEALDMQSFADAVIGVPGEGLNVEQRKRLSIAVEMAAKPELLLFLDEPTSGLDSQTAWSICSLLRRLADNGQAILCTIHQPSPQLFDMFDRLLLLERGGRTMYFGDIGDNSSTLIQYFERQGARSCGTEENPAEWVLDVTGSHGSSQSGIDYFEKWQSSPEREKVKSQLAEMKEELQSKPRLQPLEFLTEFAASPLSQLLIVTHRAFQQYWRDPVYLYSKAALSVGVGFFNGFSFYMAPLDIQGLTSILFSIFLLTFIFNNIDQQIIPRFIGARQLFEARERPSKTYSWPVFIAANVIVEIAWQTVTAVFLFIVWYYPTGLWKNGGGDTGLSQSERGGLMFGLIFVFCIFMSTLSQVIAVAMEHAETAVHIANLLSTLYLLFCGIIVTPEEFPRFWIFLYRVSPATYLVGSMVSAGIGNTRIHCSPYELLKFDSPVGETCGQYLAPYLNYTSTPGALINPESEGQCLYCPVQFTNTVLESRGIDVSDRWRDFGFQFVYITVNILATFVLYWLVRLPKKKNTMV